MIGSILTRIVYAGICSKIYKLKKKKKVFYVGPNTKCQQTKSFNFSTLIPCNAYVTFNISILTIHNFIFISFHFRGDFKIYLNKKGYFS